MGDKIARSDPGTRLGTTVGCSLGSTGGTWCGIPEGRNEWKKTW